MGDRILLYVIFFIVFVLGCMSDLDNEIRLIVIIFFVMLVKLVLFEVGIFDFFGFLEELFKGCDREWIFIGQLFDLKKVEFFWIFVVIKVELWLYQQEGVNWLYFFNKYYFYGIFCDDMGFGKML